MRRIFAFCVTAAIAVALASCSDNNGSTPCSVGPTLVPPQLLYPIPGSVGVPDNPTLLVVSGVGAAGGSLYLLPPGGGTAIAANSLGGVPSPGPSPAATTPPGGTAQAAGIPVLSASSTYTVTFTANTATACVQSQQSGAIGSFTTQ